MTSLFRLLALSLLLGLTLPATANEKIGKGDLDAQKEVLQLKIDNGRELVEKSLDGFKNRIDALDKRIDDQNNRVGDIGQSVDRFSLIVGILAILVTLVLASGGLVGYFSVTRKVAEEAKSASQKWFDDNLQKLVEQIRELEKATAEAHKKIDDSVNDVELHSNAAIEQMQTGLNTATEQAPPIGDIEQQALQQSAEQIREKPEASYSFEDWNKRAFDAYRSGQYEDAALYWKHASSIPNAGATNTAMALFNRAAVLYLLKRHDESCEAYEKLIATYSSDTPPAIREQVARGMNNMGGVLANMQKPAEAIATYEKLIATYSSDDSPVIRQQIAYAMFNKGIALGQMNKPVEAIATYEKLIATYSPAPPAIRKLFAKAMNNIGAALGQMQKPAEAIDTYEKLIATYSSDDTPVIREQVAYAMYNKGVALGQMNKPVEAIATYEKLITTYSPDTPSAIREVVAQAMSNTGFTLDKIQKPAEAIASYEKLIAAYSSDNTPAIRKQVANALNGKGFVRLMEAKKAWGDNAHALALLQIAQTDLLASFDLNPDCGMARGNLAYVQWLLGDTQAAEESFRAALAATQNGGKTLYTATLDDIAAHSIEEDGAFRSMVERLWAEYQTTNSSDD